MRVVSSGSFSLREGFVGFRTAIEANSISPCLSAKQNPRMSSVRQAFEQYQRRSGRNPIIGSAQDAAFEIMDTPTLPQPNPSEPGPERLAYSVKESADLLGVDYFSVYRLIQRGKLRACRALRGKLLVPRSELLRLLKE